MRAGVLIALLTLAGCAFGAERELFDGSDAVRPIADGARVLWIQSGTADRMEVSFHHEADGRYRIENLGEDDDTMHSALFVPIGDTPEEDYVVQLRLNPAEDAVTFTYMWRQAEGYRTVSIPGGLFPDDNLSAADPYCQWQTYQGCKITTRENVFAVYRALIYPAFVTGGQTPESYLDLMPLDETAPRPSKERG